MKRLVQIFLVAAGPALLAAWGVGFLLRDRVYELIWFYFIPAPVVVGAVSVWLGLARKRVPRWLRLSVAVLVLVPVAKIFVVDMHWNGVVDVPPGALRVTHWNVARLPFGIGGVEDVLRGDVPDICLISETGNTGAVVAAGARLGMTNSCCAVTMTLLSRFPVSAPEQFQVAGARGWKSRVTSPDGAVDVVAVDLVSKPTMRRGPPIAAVAAWLDNRNPKVPLLVLGDFNTPRDSTAFAPFRARFVHAYETAGHGWPYSWPLPFPAYQLDHAWFTDETLAVFDYGLHSSTRSDHRRQTFWIQLKRSLQ